MRFLFVANRLPFRIQHTQKDVQFHVSPGGVMSSLSAYIDAARKTDQQATFTYVGWPGSVIPASLQETIETKAREEYNAVPVYLTEEEVEAYYFGFCNKVLWPLFHYFPSFVEFEGRYWDAYKRINLHFAEKIKKILKKDDVLCIQDYQLLLLPKMLRETYPTIPISFFLHTPFPSYEVFRLLPRAWRGALLEGVLGADLIGFHTQDYTQYFLNSVLRILGVDHTMGIINVDGRTVKVETFPLGIDYEKYATAAKSREIATTVKQGKKSFLGKKIIFSIDRLDYSKGIYNRLLGYEHFLSQYPEWRSKVVFILNAEPSRTDISRYQEMKVQIERTIASINGTYGTLDWTPIVYQYTSLSFEEVVSRYALCDIALITPLRDGMNLVAKEYVASRIDGNGVLILSEMAGSIKELSEALLINPNTKEEISAAILQALTMLPIEKKVRMKLMQERIAKNDVFAWAENFNAALFTIKQMQKNSQTHMINAKIKQDIMHAYQHAERRVIFLDYDGTLVPFADRPEDAIPPKSLLSLLERLTADYRNEVVLISGRDRGTMQTWFPIAKLALVAEHGIWIKPRNEYYWKSDKTLTNTWKKHIFPLLKRYAERVPSSFIEEKTYSLAWHYRLADTTLATRVAKELVDELQQFTTATDIMVLQGDKVIEVKNMGVTKGTAVLQWTAKKKYDFVLAIGDDTTDEDMFSALPQSAVTIKVGNTHSFASYTLPNPTRVQAFLEELSQAAMKEPLKRRVIIQQKIESHLTEDRTL
jgi:trehalose 6-phosphate synthase/phosphatase